MTQHKQGWFKASEPVSPCPAADELWLFTRSELAADRRDTVRDHLTGCVWCSEKIARISEPTAGPAESAPVPDDLNRRTRRIWAVNPLQRIWRSQVLWMVLFVAALVVSFTQPRYYKQFLVIALVAGIRWALSERANRHSITVTRLDSPHTKDRTHSSHNSAHR